MKVSAKSLQYALSVMSTVVPRDPHQPIVKNVRFEGEGDVVTLEGTDGMTSTVTMELEAIDANVSFLVRLAPLSGLVQTLDGIVEMSVKGTTLIVEDEAGQTTSFALTDPETFPKTPEYAPAGFVSVNPASFVHALRLSALTGQGMVLLSAYHIVKTDGEMYIEVTDSYVGGRRFVDTANDSPETFDVVVGTYLEKPLAKLLTKESESWMVGVQDGQLFVLTENATVAASLYNNATYFDLGQYFTADKLAGIDKSEWLGHLRQLGTLGENKVQVVLGNEMVRLSVESEIGSAERFLKCRDCPDKELAIDLAATIKVLNIIKGDIMVQFGTPTVIQNAKDSYFMVGLR